MNMTIKNAKIKLAESLSNVRNWTDIDSAITNYLKSAFHQNFKYGEPIHSFNTTVYYSTEVNESFTITVNDKSKLTLKGNTHLTVDREEVDSFFNDLVAPNVNISTYYVLKCLINILRREWILAIRDKEELLMANTDSSIMEFSVFTEKEDTAP